MIKRFVLVAVAACGSGPAKSELTAHPTFTITEITGNGSSSLEVLMGQPVSFDITFALAPVYSTVDSCRLSVLDANEPIRTATGATASTVQTGVLDVLPEWDLKLALCDPASSSSVSLHSDNNMGLAVIVGCLAVPADAMVRDADGNPQWTTFVAGSCDATVYDQAHGRLLAAHGFSTMFD